MARKFATPRVPKVALLLETSTEYGRGLLRGIVRYSRLHGPWSLYVAPGHIEQALPKVRSWYGDGIIGRTYTPKMFRTIDAKALPFVASSLDELTPENGRRKFCEIRTNSNAIAHLAADHLLGCGLRRFGFCGFIDCPWSFRREQAFKDYLQTKGFHCDTHRIKPASWMQMPGWMQTWQHEQPVISKWLKSLPKPVGLMACNDVCGREMLQACAAAELDVPDDVAVVGVDNDELICDLSAPPLSSVALSLVTAGYQAARLLDGLMSKKLRGKHVVYVEPVSVATRQSTDVIAVDDPMVVSALRFIRDHAAKPISVTDVVDKVGASRRTLERRIRRAIGRSILTEMNRSRLARAKQLLLETGCSCRQVGEKAGFNSVKTLVPPQNLWVERG